MSGPVLDAGLVVEHDVVVPMRDGVRLRADVFRPEVPGPHPVLLQRHPYNPADGIMVMIGKIIAQQGYAVVVQSCRGRYGSEGDFYPHHPDVDDGYDSVEWAAAQQWSNGKVGMYGVSYSGMTQWCAALARPPHLVAIAPISCTWNWVDSSSWYYAPGVLALGMAMAWSASMTPWEAERRGVVPSLPELAEAERLLVETGFTDLEARAKIVAMQRDAIEPMFDRRPLRDVEELAELAPWFRDFCDHDDPADPYWRRTSAADHLHHIELPILNLTGWYDLFTKGGIDAFTTMRRYGGTDATRSAQRLVVGPWNHSAGITRPDVDPAANLFFSPAPDSPMMRFFAHYMKGEDPGYADEPPIRLYVMGEGWRDEFEWPLARTAWTPYFLHGDGSLSTARPHDERPDSFVYDPADPVRGSIAIGATQGDPIDPNDAGRRPDVLVYTTPPLDADVEVTGPVTLELWAASSAMSTDFTAKLIDVFPDGEAVPLCQGVVRTDHGAAHPPVPGAAYPYEIDLWATSNLFKAGHRIRLDISSSEFPTYELNPNTGLRITHDPSRTTVPATQHVFHDDLHPSRLVLPVVPPS